MHIYDRGHAFLAVGDGPFRDPGRALDDDLAAFRLHRELEDDAATRAWRERRAAELERIRPEASFGEATAGEAPGGIEGVRDLRLAGS